MSVCYDCTQEFNSLKTILNNSYTKIQLINCYNQNLYEYPGIKTLYDISDYDDDTYLLYFHSKGMTSNSHTARKKLFKYTVANYKNFIYTFDKNKNIDVGGIIPHLHGFVYYNYFWCRSSYVKKFVIEPIPSENRYIWECWIGSDFSNKKNVTTYSPFLKYDTTIDQNFATNFLNNLPDIELYNIWKKYPSDKCKDIGHDYIESYEKLFFSNKDVIKNVLEIGTGCLEHENAMIRGCSNYKNGNSIRMWRDYFPKANVYSIDIYEEGMIHNEERIKTFVADQSSKENLEYVKNQIGDEIDIIIDDGSHIAAHQVFSFIHLEMSLSDKGIYVIEDVQPEFIEQFKNLTIFLIKKTLNSLLLSLLDV
jgi:hypothetical protein